MEQRGYPFDDIFNDLFKVFQIDNVHVCQQTGFLHNNSTFVDKFRTKFLEIMLKYS